MVDIHRTSGHENFEKPGKKRYPLLVTLFLRKVSIFAQNIYIEVQNQVKYGGHRARAGPGPGLPRPRAFTPGPGPTALTWGAGTLGLASNPGPAWQAGPGFWARPRVPGPWFLRPGPWVWALGLGPLGLYTSGAPRLWWRRRNRRRRREGGEGREEE